jgi:hypothetical protein
MHQTFLTQWIKNVSPAQQAKILATLHQGVNASTAIFQESLTQPTVNANAKWSTEL